MKNKTKLFHFLTVISLTLLPLASLRAGDRPPLDQSYVIKTIAVSEGDEPHVRDAYEAFLQLLRGKPVMKGTLVFPARLSVQRPERIIFARSWFISPGELRGFEISVPKKFLALHNGLFSSTRDLVLKQATTRQGQMILELAE